VEVCREKTCCDRSDVSIRIRFVTQIPTPMDTLLAWPSTSKAFSAVQPISRDGARGSPPRKTARLEGDLDYSASGKGKQDGTQRGPRKLNVTHIRNGVFHVSYIYDPDYNTSKSNSCPIAKTRPALTQSDMPFATSSIRSTKFPFYLPHIRLYSTL